MAKLISVDKALAIIKNETPKLVIETIDLKNADGRILAEDLHAQTTLPPLSASAMDGYAVKLSNDYKVGTKLEIIGVSPAGQPFEAEVKTGQAVRIYTGGAVPKGADHVIMQENVTAKGSVLTLTEPISPASHIRKAGIDFKRNDLIIQKGRMLDSYSLALTASANIDRIKVYKRPKIALIANGDELVLLGSKLKQGQIINSNSFGLAPLLRASGAQIIDCGISKDEPEAIKAQIKQAMQADILVPIGGASVGDRDFMRMVFTELGYKKLFEKVAIKPGKPVWFGSFDNNKFVLGLPGNPASAIVTAHIFLIPLIALLSGHNIKNKAINARTKQELKPTSWRTEYIRAIANIDNNGQICVKPYPIQDSSLLTPFISANCYLVRAPESPAAKIGDIVQIMPFKPLSNM